MNALVKSGGIFGIDGYIVDTEVDLSGGLPAFDLVGLPGQAVKEARERVRAALKNSGFDFPVSRITVNLAPADIAKNSPIYDLPILTAILAASGQAPIPPATYAFAGELALSGDLRPVSGILPMAIAAEKSGLTHFFVPAGNAREAAMAKGISAVAVDSVGQLISMLKGETPIKATAPLEASPQSAENLPDFSEVKGQQTAKRALEIAAAGGHNLLMIGPPGSGKSMLAKRTPYILPPMTYEETLEVSKLYSVAGLLKSGTLITDRPFRSPHHTISTAGLSGGSSIPKPGELSLAHLGILFLDELPEFSRSSLETLRQPLEDGVVTISRVRQTYTFPCRITLIAAMNPCKCGYYGDPSRKCVCSEAQIDAYLKRLSGPLLDRIDLHVLVPALKTEEVESEAPAESSADIRRRVVAARQRQTGRFEQEGIRCNAEMSRRHIKKYCSLEEAAADILRDGYARLSLSARSYDRILKVARTIADLAGRETISATDVAEALSLRGDGSSLRRNSIV